MASFDELKTKKDRIAHIRTMLASNPQWAIKGLIRIYENQTDDEQANGITSHDNGIGFNGVDSELLSSFAEHINRGRTMSPKQMDLILKKMPKYARQLETISR